jgi:diaminopimelate decarboxylase
MEKETEKYFPIIGGELYIEGVRAAELAERFGTPLYVYSESLIRSRFAEIRRGFTDKYPGSYAAYAGKAFLTPEMCRIVAQEGCHLDVVSAGELFTANRAGFPPGDISYHGNNKTYDELENAISSGVGRIIVDGQGELEAIEKIAEKHGRRQTVLFRITPEVDAGAHAHITTGRRDSKFGVPVDDHILYPLINKAIESPHIMFKGLHFHIGSQIFENGPYLEAAGKTLEILKEIQKRFSYGVEELVIGGGFGIRYTEGEVRQPYSYYLDPIQSKIKGFCNESGLAPPAVGIEPGRSIVGDAGVTLYTVGTIKQIPGGSRYVSIDGGMSDNIRPALYGAKYEAVIANKAGVIPSEKVVVCGKLCESGDRIIEDAVIAPPERGDTLCVFATGAYGYSMANNYNKLPKPAVVFVNGGDARLAVKRQTLESMTSDEL